MFSQHNLFYSIMHRANRQECCCSWSGR